MKKIVLGRKIRFFSRSLHGGPGQVEAMPVQDFSSGLRAVTAPIDRAILATVGRVPSHDGRVILTFFSADAGGFTESARVGLGLNAPYRVATREMLDSRRSKSLRKKKLTLGEATAKLKRH